VKRLTDINCHNGGRSSTTRGCKVLISTVDDADFSLNLWITPDSANLDPTTGGFVVWDKTAPSDWSFDDYNSGGDRVRQYLRDTDAESTVIPYRENRAVLFEGDLFHQTDEFTFAPGFANRRRSLTFLFRRCKR